MQKENYEGSKDAKDPKDNKAKDAKQVAGGIDIKIINPPPITPIEMRMIHKKKG